MAYVKPSSRLRKGWFYYWLLDNWIVSSGEMAGSKYSFEHYPFMIDVCKDDAPRMVSMKAAQIGFTEIMVAKLFATADLLPGNLMYVLPTDDLATTLSRARLRNATLINPYLEQSLSGFETMRQFKFRDNYIYIRGSQTQIKDGRTYQRQLISIDVSKLFGDEVDEWNAGVHAKLMSRLGASRDPYEVYFTTPRLPDGEMARLFEQSTQKYWGIKCRSCNHWNVPLTLWDNVSNHDFADLPHSFICSECGGDLDRKENDPKNAQWIALKPDTGKWSGYHFSKLFFPNSDLDYIVERFNNQETQTECYNDDLGLPHKDREYNIDDKLLHNCIADRQDEFERIKSVCDNKSIGIDIGKTLHATVRGNYEGKPYLFDYFTTQTFDEIKHYCLANGIRQGICDAQPDFRASLQFCEEMSLFGDFRVAYYDTWTGNVKEKELIKEDHVDHVVNIARNLAMGKVMFEFITQNIVLPPGIQHDKEFFAHIQTPSRIFKKDARTGQTVVNFPPARKPDHYYHSMVYSFCAEQLTPFEVTVLNGGATL